VLRISDYININANTDATMEAYLDVDNWSELFSDTILVARIVAITEKSLEIEVQHRYEGRVLNILSLTDKFEIKLEEFKRRYDAIFINRFTSTAFGCRYDIEAQIKFKGAYRFIEPFVKSLAKRRIAKLVLLPMKKHMEMANN